MLTFSNFLEDSRSLDRYELSAVIKSALAAKGVTSLTTLQEHAVEAFVGRPKGWYIDRPSDIPYHRDLIFVGPEEPKNLKEGEKATQRVLTVKMRQDMICLAETGESIRSLRT